MFKDANGKEWTVKLDGPKIEAVRKVHGIDLAVVDGSAAERLRIDFLLLINVLYFICKQQAEAAAITATQFGEAVYGDALGRGTDALIGAINDFFPQPLREKIQQLHAQMEETREAAMGQTMAGLTDPGLKEKILEATKKNLDAEIQQLLTRLSSATNSPEPSASPPTA